MVITLRLPMWLVRRLVPASKFKAAERHGIARHSRRWLHGDIEITHEITYNGPRKDDDGQQ